MIKFHINHFLTGLGLIFTFLGGLLYSDQLPKSIGFIVMAISIFILVLFYYQLCLQLYWKELLQIKEIKEQEINNIHAYLTKSKPIPLHIQYQNSFKVFFILFLFIITFLGAIKIQGTMGFPLLIVGMMIAISFSSYLYYKTRRNVLLALMQADK